MLNSHVTVSPWVRGGVFLPARSFTYQEVEMKFKLARTLFAATLVVGAGMGMFASSARAQPENPKLRHSWLVPGACPFCDWGATCGCTPQ